MFIRMSILIVRVKVMIKRSELITWECGCEKCGHCWNTRTDKVPKVCPECRSWIWNASADKPTIDTSLPQKEKIEALRELTGIKPVPAAEPAEVWLANPVTYDQSTGEDVWTERHYKTGKNREIRRETHYD